MNEVHNKNVLLQSAAETKEVVLHILRMEEPI